ncbi:fatty acid amide hydrolase-like isoform X2 [Magnolia sinica]|uniref:fatty acid amide hydrolase-like isoform X2 n=1 Tax=Magnolia sinica TaxID=86752 RepID=UPI002658368E|nr:fatty acid amide hydrolase-like isoform X2 [Magnolia sinica]
MGFFSTESKKVYQPAGAVDLSSDSNETYLRANVKAPRLAGLVVKIFVWILELRILGPLVVYILKRDNLIHKLISFAEMEEPPAFLPEHLCEDIEERESSFVERDLSPSDQVQQAVQCLPLQSETVVGDPASSFRRWTIQDYARAYSSRATTPLVVAERFITAVKDSSKPDLQMSFFINHYVEDILRQATESTLRYEKGKPISVLDGVPIAVKDEIDCMPYPTTGGTKWLHNMRNCKNDACCVSRLRSCGAIIVGKTNMHELGLGTSGINPHYGVARNPYDTSKVAGGSSSGSAAVVSAGLCPVALGVDGGGSVRMPAALCGVVGFKPTFRRIPHSGVLPLNWTVGMVGILAATVEDALIAYAAMSGDLPSNEPTALLPRVNIPLLKSTHSISNVKLAKYGEWFNDCNDEIRSCCNQALDRLCMQYGWKTMEVTVPEIEVMRLAHYSTIGSECTASLGPLLEKLNIKESGWDARVALRIYRSFSSKEYLNAQRIRNRQMHFHMKIFKKADVIVTPTTGVTAYPIKSDALKYGELDYINGGFVHRKLQRAKSFL